MRNPDAVRNVFNNCFTKFNLFRRIAPAEKDCLVNEGKRLTLNLIISTHLKNMAQSYNCKVVVSGKQVEVYEYKKPIWRDFNKPKKKKEDEPKKEPKQLDIFKQLEIKKQKAKFSINRTRTEIRRLVNANPQLNKFMTLTFADNVTDLKTANYLFNKFVMRISYKYSGFEYLAVPEFQKRGAVHYHVLCKLPFVQITQLQEIWGQGFIKINRIDNVNNVGAYVCKYLSKDMFDERTFGKKKFFRSQTLSEAVEILGWWAMRFAEKVLSLITPVFEKTFTSEWTGEVNYKAYSLKENPLLSGVIPRFMLKPI